MPPKIDLEPYKDEILSWVSEKHTIPEILSKIRGILRGMPLYRRQLAQYRLDLSLIRRIIIEERKQKY
ncbi:uncharacterized protein K444DRAFT_620280 [Hyaloscypha bicolor E]|uniref:Uncharacterized protein n=1 Tax=Hyaloscypha bicolor E TaxID=1095630 RepID=A0A2J6SK14_9HELO|nr:uncharacterized protein K444DRAFT_620280 [Hyaloscypha bicolor E]PMD51118.1 hypothetical protein K444DRAFT_620280 [Hyaloscypha bicolor E]